MPDKECVALHCGGASAIRHPQSGMRDRLQTGRDVRHHVPGKFTQRDQRVNAEAASPEFLGKLFWPRPAVCLF